MALGSKLLIVFPNHSHDGRSESRLKRRLAKEDSASLNQWIGVAAVAQKVGAVETVAAFFRRRGSEAKPEDLLEILGSVPDAPPEPGDERDGDS